MNIVDDWNKRIGLPEMLLSLGEDLTRRELQDTPERMHKAWEEQLSGYTLHPEDILAQKWPIEGGGIQVCRNIFFSSLCEHHFLPFIGHCSIGYEPSGEVAGLSKLIRLVDCFAQRLQIQERLVNQIADAIDKHLEPRGVLVVAHAQHLCCVGRGVKRESVEFVTGAERGDVSNRLYNLVHGME